MNAVLEQPATGTYSAKHMRKPVNFFYATPDAKAVNLMGDFNNWDPKSLPMERRVDGWWSIQVPLTHGHHHYLFLVDGRPELDPHATGTVQVDRYSTVSLIAVS
jgi:1,4-alpha-glucan branching enzyme